MKTKTVIRDFVIPLCINSLQHRSARFHKNQSSISPWPRKATKTKSHEPKEKKSQKHRRLLFGPIFSCIPVLIWK
jgi:hypothetical protein